MGRVKLKIQKLENSSGRQSTYSKRKNGIIKKARELAILCDIDIILLMFSPSGKPTLFKGHHSTIEEVLERYSLYTPQERERRKLESLEALKKAFKKSNHDVKIRDFLGPSYISVEDLRTQAESQQIRLSEVQKKLRNYTTLDTIDSIEHLGQMEVSLRESLDQLQMRKENLGKQQQMELQSLNEFQDGLHPSFTFGIDEQLQSLPWVPNKHSQHMILPNNFTSFPLRDPDHSAVTSFDSYPGLLSSGNNIMTKDVQQNNSLAELNGMGYMNLQPSDQFNLQVHERAYPSYNLKSLNTGVFQPTQQMNMQETTIPLDRKFEIPQPGYDPLQHGWATSAPGTCGTATFEEHLFPQFHCTSDDHVMKDLDYMLMKAAPPPSLIN